MIRKLLSRGLPGRERKGGSSACLASGVRAEFSYLPIGNVPVRLCSLTQFCFLDPTSNIPYNWFGGITSFDFYLLFTCFSLVEAPAATAQSIIFDLATSCQARFEEKKIILLGAVVHGKK